MSIYFLRLFWEFPLHFLVLDHRRPKSQVQSSLAAPGLAPEGPASQTAVDLGPAKRPDVIQRLVESGGFDNSRTPPGGRGRGPADWAGLWQQFFLTFSFLLF